MFSMKKKSTALPAGSLNLEQQTKLVLQANKNRRGEVFVEHIDLEDRYSIQMTPKPETTNDILKKAMSNNLLFNRLSAVDRDLLIASMTAMSCESGVQIIAQGTKGDLLYIIESGKFEYLVDDKVVGEGKSGSMFGELGVLYDSPRAASVIAKEKSKLWTLSRNTFRKVVLSSKSKTLHQIRGALRSVKLLDGLSDEQVTQLSDLVEFVNFKKGDKIIRKGDQGSIFYFIRHGEVTCTDIGKDLSTLNLQQGDYFGERSLIKMEPRDANVIATTDCECIALDKQEFDKYLGELIHVLDANLGKRVLKSLPLFQELDAAALNEMVEQFKLVTFKEGDFIVKQGEPGQDFYIIRDGSAKVFKTLEGTKENADIAVLKSGDYFGEGALLKDEPRAANVQAVEGSVTTFVLNREAFNIYMDKIKATLVDQHFKRKDETEDKVKVVQKSVDAKMQFSDLIQVRTLGTGTFGRVKLVKHKDTKATFAMKILQKAVIYEYAQEKNVMNEKNILAECDHPFILRLFKTFKDENCLYMLLELVHGGELFALIHVHGGKLPGSSAQFYGGCVLDAFEYIHDKKVVYRDLKPENLLIDDKGYCKVVDFGFAKRVHDKTYTLCGTPEYFAPEIVLGLGHNKGVDYWGLGVLFFEMLTRQTPFVDPDHMIMYQNIVSGKVDFPDYYPKDARELTELLLCREPAHRIGSLRNGARDIKQHHFFQSLNFNDLYRKRIPAPWVPVVKGDDDVSNFEVYEENDKITPYVRKGPEWDTEF